MNKAHFSELIRPVHPEFYVQEETPESSRQERSFTHTILRIDPFLDLWQKESHRRDSLSKIVGIEPADAQSWREFIKRIFDLAAKNHTTGIKQLQAYRRSLLYQPRTDTEVTFRGELNDKDITCFQDWVMHECCKQAHERNWSHQVHVGTNNIAHSSPMPLESLANLYPKMQIVMIHCWPFLKEAGWLAKMVPNMHIDTCWLPVLNPAFFHEALNTWINYVPVHKIMMAHDSTHVEMATGSSLFTREILGEILLYQQNTLQISTSDLRSFAADMLHNNAVRLYKIGKEYNA
jgi:predicted TIM-barrel fold metal-dependent hydrolase